MALLFAGNVERRQRLRRAAGRRHDRQAGAEGGREDDPAVGTPGAAARRRRVADRLRRAAAQVEALQLAVGEEGDLAPSGDQNGVSPPAVDWSLVASPRSSSRSQSPRAPVSLSRASKTIRRPSGDSAKVSLKPVPAGATSAAWKTRSLRRASRSRATAPRRAPRRRCRRRREPHGEGRRTRRDRRPDGAAGARSSGRGSARASSIATRASPIDCSRSRGFLRRQRRTSSTMRGGVAGRQRREVGRVLEDAGEDVRHGLAVEEPPAGEHLVEHDAERPDVGAAVDGGAGRLLRRHVGRGAEDHAHLRAVRRGGSASSPGSASARDPPPRPTSSGRSPWPGQSRGL